MHYLEMYHAIYELIILGLTIGLYMMGEVKGRLQVSEHFSDFTVNSKFPRKITIRACMDFT